MTPIAEKLPNPNIGHAGSIGRYKAGFLSPVRMGYTRSRELNEAINKVLNEAKKKDLPGLLAAQREGKVCTLLYPCLFTFTC